LQGQTFASLLKMAQVFTCC